MSAEPAESVPVPDPRVLAARLGCPAEVVATVEALERRFPAWRVWWSRHRPRHAPGPGYGAALKDATPADERVYANSAETLALAIERAEQARRQSDR